MADTASSVQIGDPQPGIAFAVPVSRPAGWGAVLALTLCVSTLIASEFMPVSILTPIASGAGLVGTWLIGRVVEKSLSATLTFAPLAMAAIALALIAASSMALPTGALLALWGLIGTALPVAWWTWLSRALPDDAEAGGGLMVAVIQLAITLGAAGGGFLFDAIGFQATFLASAVLLGGSALLGALDARKAS